MDFFPIIWLKPQLLKRGDLFLREREKNLYLSLFLPNKDALKTGACLPCKGKNRTLGVIKEMLCVRLTGIKL